MASTVPRSPGLALAFAAVLAATLLAGAGAGAGGCATGGGTSATGDDGGEGGVPNADASVDADGGDATVDASPCSGGKTQCNGACTSTGNDPKNCGTCGKACAADQVCTMGMCALGCSPGETLCGGPGEAGSPGGDAGGEAGSSDAEAAPEGGGGGGDGASEGGSGPADGGTAQPICTNLSTDPSNCGSCGNACPASEMCVNGNCSLSCDADAGQRVCFAGPACIPMGTCCTSADCTVTGQTCSGVGGQCGCPSGEKACAATNSCISSNDCCSNADCASISGATCPTPGQACQCANGDKACLATGMCIPKTECCTAADCMGEPNVSTYTCTAGACGIGTCNMGCYDLDMQYADGCECCEDTYGKACATPTAVGTLTLGAAAQSFTGQLPTPTDGDWFQVAFQSESNTAFHGLITLATNPNGEFVLDILQGSCGGSPLPCGEGGSCTAKTTWEVSYAGPSPPADPNSPKFTPIAAIGTVYVHVYRASTSTAATCDKYTLQVSE